jgi:hypothetical protein
MAKVQVEFINTCPSCDGYARMIESVAGKFGAEVAVKIYYTGKDMDYIRKYGMVTKGTMIINGKKRIDNITRSIIEKTIEEELER